MIRCLIAALILFASPASSQTTEERLDALELDVFQLKEIHGLNPPPPSSCDTLALSVEADDPHINQGPQVLCDALALTARVNAASWPAWARVIDASQGSQDQDADLQLTGTDQNQARARFCAGGTTIVLIGGTITTEDQRWDLTYDGVFVRLYLDAVQVASAPKTGAPCNRGLDMWIGGTSTQQQFDGYMYNVEIRDYMDGAAILAEWQAETGGSPPPSGSGSNTSPGTPPGAISFAEARVLPSVVYSNGFDTQADKDRCSGDTSILYNMTHKIAIDTAVKAEGLGSVRLTIDDSNGMDMAGTLSCDHPDVSSGSIFYSWEMRTGNGWHALSRRGGAGTYSGTKYAQFTAGPRSCSNEEVTLADITVNSWTTGVLQLVPTCSDLAWWEGGDWQPVSGSLDDCGYLHFVPRSAVPSGGPPNEMPPCFIMGDDKWHLLTLEIRIGVGVRLWLDNVKIIDQGANPNGVVPVGPYGYFHFDNYATGHAGGEIVGRQNDIGISPAESLWPVHYDAVLISTECVRGCGV